MRKREKRGDGTDHHEKLDFKRILCASQFAIRDTAGMRYNPLCDHTNMRSSQPNQASRTPHFSYPLVSATLLLSLSPISLILVRNYTLIAEHNVMSSLPISRCDDHEFTPSTSKHLVQSHTECSIYRVQHPPMIVWFPFIVMITS
jgi:hypothetical protein